MLAAAAALGLSLGTISAVWMLPALHGTNGRPQLLPSVFLRVVICAVARVAAGFRNVQRYWVRKSIEFGLDGAGRPDLAELAAEKIQPAYNRKVRNRRGDAHDEHRRGLAPPPRRRRAGQSLAVPPSRRRSFDSSPRVRRLCPAKALLEHTARWRVRSGAATQSPLRECGGLGAPSPGYSRSSPYPHNIALWRPEPPVVVAGTPSATSCAARLGAVGGRIRQPRGCIAPVSRCGGGSIVLFMGSSRKNPTKNRAAEASSDGPS